MSQDYFNFDEAAARQARDEAIARVEANAKEAWKEEALDAVRRVCETRERFFVDDVWKTGLDRPREGRAIGAIMRSAKHSGWCEPTDQFQLSAQPQCHANPRRVWRSLIKAPGAAGGTAPGADGPTPSSPRPWPRPGPMPLLPAAACGP